MLRRTLFPTLSALLVGLLAAALLSTPHTLQQQAAAEQVKILSASAHLATKSWEMTLSQWSAQVQRFHQSMAQPMDSGSAPSLHQTLSNLTRRKGGDLIRAAVLNRDGLVIAHSTSAGKAGYSLAHLPMVKRCMEDQESEEEGGSDTHMGPPMTSTVVEGDPCIAACARLAPPDAERGSDSRSILLVWWPLDDRTVRRMSLPLPANVDIILQRPGAIVGSTLPASQSQAILHAATVPDQDLDRTHPAAPASVQRVTVHGKPRQVLKVELFSDQGTPLSLAVVGRIHVDMDTLPSPWHTLGLLVTSYPSSPRWLPFFLGVLVFLLGIGVTPRLLPKEVALGRASMKPERRPIRYPRLTSTLSAEAEEEGVSSCHHPGKGESLSDDEPMRTPDPPQEAGGPHPEDPHHRSANQALPDHKPSILERVRSRKLQRDQFEDNLTPSPKSDPS